LRDMLQQFRHMFDRAVFGAASEDKETRRQGDKETEGPPHRDRLPAPELPPEVKSLVVVEAPAGAPAGEGASSVSLSSVWDQEVRAARRKLEPEGALTGATRELQMGLGAFLQTCHEQGVKVGPWRLCHVAPEWTFGEHPTYGALSVAHWVCK